MFKKLLLILSLTAVSTQSDLNAISFKEMRKSVSSKLGKAKNFCWKTGPRKAATLISVSVVFYTLLAKIHQKIHGLDGFWDTFVKQGTHPLKMWELNGSYFEKCLALRKQLKLNDDENAAWDVVYKAQEEFTKLLTGINYTDGDKSKILANYDKITDKKTKDAIDETFNLANNAVEKKWPVKTQAQAFLDQYKVVTDIQQAIRELGYGTILHEFNTQVISFEEMPKRPSCCAPTD